MNKVRTRYAPSPTGLFHIGGARTALFNYLFAKHNNGDFIVRIEDTDIDRNISGGIDSQLNNLDWLGIKYDESIKNPGNYGPYIQTSKLDRYKELAYKLVSENKAYFCFCSKEELEKNRANFVISGITPKYSKTCLNLTKEQIDQKIAQKIPFVIRLKIEDNINVEWEDLIRGKITVPTSALTDPVILKSNNIPMYNFAVVIDDFDMDISHVIRGEEHISNTPYQICIKQALGFESKEIKYGHLSVIVNEQGKKLSKRDLSLKQFIEDYKKIGFLNESIINFMCLLGWTNPNNKEIFSIDEAIKNFTLEHVSKSPTFFDYKKMEWVGNQYFKNLNEIDYINFIDKFLNINLLNFENKKKEIFLLFKNQISNADCINKLIQETFFNDEKVIFSDEEKQVLISFKKTLERYNNDISYEEGKNIILEVKKSSKQEGKNLFMPIRKVLTNSEHGPELNKIISIYGKEIINNKLINYKI